MSLYQDLCSAFERNRHNARLVRVYERFREFTMIPPEAYVKNLELAERVKEVPGCVVECGVWRGGMMAGLATILGAERRYFLFDSFEGLPPAKEVDGEAALRWQQNKDSPGYHDNCAAGEEFAQRAMILAGVSSFQLVKGWFEKTLPTFRPPEPIALLRLDGDWYESTMVCLEALFCHVAPGGLIVLDDYHTWDGCSRAVHDYLSKHGAVERIHSLGDETLGRKGKAWSDICYIKKLETPSPSKK